MWSIIKYCRVRYCKLRSCKVLWLIVECCGIFNNLHEEILVEKVCTNGMIISELLLMTLVSEVGILLPKWRTPSIINYSFSMLSQDCFSIKMALSGSLWLISGILKYPLSLGLALFRAFLCGDFIFPIIIFWLVVYLIQEKTSKGCCVVVLR